MVAGLFMSAGIETEVGLLRDQVRQLARAVEQFSQRAASPWLGRDEAAAWLGVSRDVIDGLIGSGQLPARRLGRRVLLRKEDLESCLR